MAPHFITSAGGSRSFWVLRVNCQTDEVQYAKGTSGEREDELTWSKGEEVARAVCERSVP